MIRAETPIAFGEIPIVDTFRTFEAAIGSLVTTDYACVLGLTPNMLPDSIIHNGHFNDSDIMLRALKVLLVDQYRELDWKFDHKRELCQGAGVDIGLHTDFDKDQNGVQFRPSPAAVVLDYHTTAPDEGDFDVSFALPKDRYERVAHLPYLRDLFKEGKTDPNLIELDSFRRRRLEHGGTIVFTLRRPGARAQLHDFSTRSPYRLSEVTLMAGEPRHAA